MKGALTALLLLTPLSANAWSMGDRPELPGPGETVEEQTTTCAALYVTGWGGMNLDQRIVYVLLCKISGWP